MTSTFWLQPAGINEDFDEDFYSSESEEDSGQKQAVSRFDTYSDDDEQEHKRVFRTFEQKKWDELLQSIKVIRPLTVDNDWHAICKEWEMLQRAIKKSIPVFAKVGVPPFLIVFLAQLEDLVQQKLQKDTDESSTLPPYYHALNLMKQKLKKWFVSNPDFEEKVAEYRENPASIEDALSQEIFSGSLSSISDWDDGGGSGFSTNEPSALLKPKLHGRVKWLKRAEDDDSSDSDSDTNSSWLNDSDDEASDSSASASSTMVGASKKSTSKVTTTSKKSSTWKTSGTSKNTGDEESDSGNSNLTSDVNAEQPIEWSAEKIDQKHLELVLRRGTKNYDRLAQVANLSSLLAIAREKALKPGRILHLLFSLVDALFDANPNMSSHLNIRLWKSCYNHIYEIIELLILFEAPETCKEDYYSEHFFEDNISEIRMTLLSQFKRLDEEFVKSLQFMDPHSKDYIARLRHENILLKLACVIFDYYAACNEMEMTAAVASVRLDHLHYRRQTEGSTQRQEMQEAQRLMLIQEDEATLDYEIQEMTNSSKDESLMNNADSLNSTQDADSTLEDAQHPKPQDGDNSDVVASVQTQTAPLISMTLHPVSSPLSFSDFPNVSLRVPPVADDSDLTTLVPQLCLLIYRSGNENLKIRATLQHVYHLALHDKYLESEIILSSPLQDDIISMEIPLQILYNRALIQLGLAAFRQGRIAEAHSALLEIASSNRVKELLAQGIVNRQGDKMVEQEKLERRRQMPYPMHINTDMLDFAHLTSAMLLEVPNMACNSYDTRKRVISKAFRKIMDRQVFNGPPENIRDHVVAASKALIQGETQRCIDLLLNLDVWKIMPKAEQVKAILRRRIQDEALRTYLFANSQYYTAIKIQSLSAMFGLPCNLVHSIISKMIHQEELRASLDQPSGVVCFNGQNPTKLQFLCLQFSERVTSLVESAESQDSRQGYGKERWNEGDRQGQRQNDRHFYRFSNGNNASNSSSTMHSTSSGYRGDANYRMTGSGWNKGEKRNNSNMDYYSGINASNRRLTYYPIAVGSNSSNSSRNSNFSGQKKR